MLMDTYIRAIRRFRSFDGTELHMNTESAVIVAFLEGGKCMYVDANGNIGVDDCSHFKVSDIMIDKLFFG